MTTSTTGSRERPPWVRRSRPRKRAVWGSSFPRMAAVFSHVRLRLLGYANAAASYDHRVRRFGYRVGRRPASRPPRLDARVTPFAWPKEEAIVRPSLLRRSDVSTSGPNAAARCRQALRRLTNRSPGRSSRPEPCGIRDARGDAGQQAHRHERPQQRRRGHQLRGSNGDVGGHVMVDRDGWIDLATSPRRR